MPAPTGQSNKPFTPRAGGAPMRPRTGPGGPSRGPGGAGGDRRGGGRRPAFDRPKPEYDQKILGIRRVTRVVAGGRRMSFAVALVIGDRKGVVGVGTGKATDTSLAIAKAQKAAKKNLIVIKLTKENSIPHDVAGKFSSSEVMLMPNRGRGMIAGSAIRDILILAGVKDVSAKVQTGSKNKLNIARACMVALERVSSPRIIRAEEPKPVAPVVTLKDAEEVK